MKNNVFKKLVAVLCATVFLGTVGCGNTSAPENTAAEETAASEDVQQAEIKEEETPLSDSADSETSESETSAESTDGKITIVDQLGKTIELDGVPERVATTIMPFPYIFYAVVGNNDNLVGCNPSSIVAYNDSALKYMYPELANADTSFVDTSFVVNVEELIKLKPDVVFQWNYMDDEIKKMEDAGIKVIALQYGSIEDLETWINIIATMMGKPERAQELITYFHDSVKEVDDKLAGLSKDDFSNVLLLSDDMKVTGTGFSTYWLEHSGAISPSSDLSGEALNVNMEQIYEWNPDIIYIGNFTSLQPSDLLENKLEGEDWSVVSAVQKGQVYKIPIGGYRWDPPGVETPLMIKWLAKTQHPDLFEDMDMNEEVKEFYKDVYNFDLTQEMLDDILGDTQN
ncbi:MAG: peptide ABC transporter substrate-binding protein [Butyrivibrio sp.]|nr:peptide ABC transporter substrate-binding protein [Butyrivibrio sp.]